MDEIVYTNSFVECHYESDSHAALERHIFSVVLTLPVAYMLLYNRNLRRFYTPLARLVNMSIILNMLCAVLFYMYYPYEQGRGNCAEILGNRINTIAVIFAELHQVFVIAMSLGLGDTKISILSFPKLRLVTTLNIAFAMMFVAVMASFILANHMTLDLVEDNCTLVVSLFQMYIIKLARKNGFNSEAVVPASDNAVAIFEQLTIAQVIATLFCVVYRVGNDIMGIPLLGDINAVLLNIDTFCTFLFYAKALIIKEKTTSVVVGQRDDDKV
jgi:hypothetical protein